MAKIAYIGPKHTFSHDLLRRAFKKDEHLPCDNLGEVVRCVVKRSCDLGVVPFYNTTRKNIEETQIELINHRNKVFVTDVIPMEIKHFLCGFGNLAQITEIRSKNVVFHQASLWLEKKLPQVERKEWESTALAVRSLVEEKPENIAAIGTKSACQGYGVPILAAEIQNRPENVTSFFVVSNQKPDPRNMDRVLMCITDVKNAEKEEIGKMVNESDCVISSNWPLKTKGKDAYFFEIDGEYAKLYLHSLVSSLTGRFKKCFCVGGYSGKCITSLIFSRRN